MSEERYLPQLLFSAPIMRKEVLMDRSTHRAIIVHLPEDLWAKVKAMTPPQFHPQDTIKIAVEAFVQDSSVKTDEISAPVERPTLRFSRQ
jgi:hypothetical protein